MKNFSLTKFQWGSIDITLISNDRPNRSYKKKNINETRIKFTRNELKANQTRRKLFPRINKILPLNQQVNLPGGKKIPPRRPQQSTRPDARETGYTRYINTSNEIDLSSLITNPYSQREIDKKKIPNPI